MDIPKGMRFLPFSETAAFPLHELLLEYLDIPVIFHAAHETA
jgi:hypothetical protein